MFQFTGWVPQLRLKSQKITFLTRTSGMAVISYTSGTNIHHTMASSFLAKDTDKMFFSYSTNADGKRFSGFK